MELGRRKLLVRPQVLKAPCFQHSDPIVRYIAFKLKAKPDFLFSFFFTFFFRELAGTYGAEEAGLNPGTNLGGTVGLHNWL